MSDEGIRRTNAPVELDHFQTIQLIGKGGFGKVEVARYRSSDVLVAIKRINKKRIARSKRRMRALWVERNLMIMVRSPFVTPLLWAFQDEEHAYLVMPHMAGGDMWYYLKRHGAMSEELARFYLAELVLALEAVHSHNIVFRDLKPRNLLLDGKGHLYLCDFGLARQLTKSNDFTIQGNSGTDLYLAPELLADRPYNTCVDVWGIGICAYQFLFARRPFEKNEYAQHYAVPFPDDIQISNTARNLILRLLEKDPSRRLGCGPDGMDEIKRHPFFEGLDWEALAAKKINPPFQPNCSEFNNPQIKNSSTHSSGNKEEDFELNELDQYKFRHFDFNTAAGSDPLSAPQEYLDYADTLRKSLDRKFYFDDEVHNFRINVDLTAWSDRKRGASSREKTRDSHSSFHNNLLRRLTTNTQRRQKGQGQKDKKEAKSGTSTPNYDSVAHSSRGSGLTSLSRPQNLRRATFGTPRSGGHKRVLKAVY